MRNILLCLTCIMTTLVVAAQTKTTKSEYIATYHKIAIEEMQRTGVPASITLAQGILESGSGNSALAINANNHFGIKCHKEWSGKGYHMDDDAKNECFRVYRNIRDSYQDHSDFLITRSRYSGLFQLDKYDYKGWSHGLKKAGYATNPKYAKLLIDLIETWDLHQYDLMGSTAIASAKVRKDKSKGSNPKQKSHRAHKDKKTAPVKAVAPTSPGNVFILNRIKTIKTSSDATLLNIAVSHQVNVNRLKKYNDMKDGDPVIEGTNIFLQPKRKKGNVKYHKVNQGETMYEISQLHGIKLESLYKVNMMPANTQAYPGELLSLRKKRSYPPQVRSYEAVLKEKQKLANGKWEGLYNKSQDQTQDQKFAVFEDKAAQDEPVEQLIEKPVVNIVVDNAVSEATLNIVDRSVSPTETIVDLIPEVNNSQTSNEIEKFGNSPENAYTMEDNSVYYYKVEPGNTLYAISQWFRVDVEKIKQWNGLNSNNISIGQILIVGK